MNALNISAPRCGAASSRGRCRDKERLPDWRNLLPKEWTACVVEPRAFSRFRDYEIFSERVVGHECEGEDSPC